MTKKTRYFMAGSSAVLVAALGTGLFAYYGGGFPSLLASRSGPAELAYVPADASVVAYANVQEVMNSELRQRLKAAMPAKDMQGQQEFARETGIDIERDIQYVIAAMTSPDGGNPNGLVVARGNFNPTQLETLARDHGAQVEEYKGKRLVTVSNTHNAPDGQDATNVRPGVHAITLAFLEPGLVAIGSDQAIKSSIDAQLSAHSITSNDDMMSLVSDIESGNTAWAVGRFDTIANQAHLPENVREKLPAVKTFAVMTHIDGGISGTLRADTRDDQSAENLRQVVQGFLALGRMQAQNNPQVAAMIQSLQLSGTGTTVNLSFDVPAEIINMIPKGGIHDGGERPPLPPTPPTPPVPPTPDR